MSDTLEQEISESAVTEYQLQQGQLQDESEHLQRELEALKQQRKAAPHHVLVKDLPEEYGFTRLRSERKHFLDTIKMISYRAETSMVSIVREKLARSDDGRALLRQIFATPVDLIRSDPGSAAADSDSEAAPPHTARARRCDPSPVRRTERDRNAVSGNRAQANLQTWLFLIP